MSNEHGSPLNASQSELQRTNKPLVVSCDYNTNLQDLTFDSAQDCSCDELRAVVRVLPSPPYLSTEKVFLRSRKPSISLSVHSRCGGMTIMESRTLSRTKRHWTKRLSTTSPPMKFQSLSPSKSLKNTMGAVTWVWSEVKQTRYTTQIFPALCGTP